MVNDKVDYLLVKFSTCAVEIYHKNCLYQCLPVGLSHRLHRVSRILKKSSMDFTTKHTKDTRSSLRKESLYVLCGFCTLCG